MNSFYASVECLFDPSIRNKPVAVVGDIEQRHGIILTKIFAFCTSLPNGFTCLNSILLSVLVLYGIQIK